MFSSKFIGNTKLNSSKINLKNLRKIFKSTAVLYSSLNLSKYRNDAITKSFKHPDDLIKLIVFMLLGSSITSLKLNALTFTLKQALIIRKFNASTADDSS